MIPGSMRRFGRRCTVQVSKAAEANERPKKESNDEIRRSGQLRNARRTDEGQSTKNPTHDAPAKRYALDGTNGTPKITNSRYFSPPLPPLLMRLQQLPEEHTAIRAKGAVSSALSQKMEEDGLLACWWRVEFDYEKVKRKAKGGMVRA